MLLECQAYVDNSAFDREVTPVRFGFEKNGSVSRACGGIRRIRHCFRMKESISQIDASKTAVLLALQHKIAGRQAKHIRAKEIVL